MTALEDALTFLSWVCFDICKLEIQEEASRLGLGSYSSTADIDIIGIEKKLILINELLERNENLQP